MFQWTYPIDVFGITAKSKPKEGCNSCLYLHENELKKWKCVCDCHEKTEHIENIDFIGNGETD